MTLKTLIEQAEKEFDEKPWGVTKAVNMEIAGEVKGLSVPARDDFKDFLRTFARKVAEETIAAVTPEQKMTIEEVVEANRDLSSIAAEEAYHYSRGWIVAHDEVKRRSQEFLSDL